MKRPPLTEKQSRVLQALKIALRDGGPVTFSRLSKLSGCNKGAVSSHLEQLERKNYVCRMGELGSPRWRVEFRGTPVITERGSGSRRWTAEEDAAVLGLGSSIASSDPQIDAITVQIQRTRAAIVERIRGFGLGRHRA